MLMNLYRMLEHKEFALVEPAIIYHAKTYGV